MRVGICQKESCPRYIIPPFSRITSVIFRLSLINFYMHLFTAFLLVVLATVRAQTPHCSSNSNISDVALFYQIDAGISLLNGNSRAKALLNGPTKVTVLTTLNIPLYQYFEGLIPGPLSPAAKVAELGRTAAAELTDIFRYLILNGTFDSTSFKEGFNFVPSSLFDPPKYHHSQPAKIGIYIDDLNFYVRSGQNRTSKIVLKVRRLSLESLSPATLIKNRMFLSAMGLFT